MGLISRVSSRTYRCIMPEIVSKLNRAVLKLTHLMLTLAIWTTGILKTIFSTIFSGVMGSMLKGSQIQDIHNTLNISSMPKHAAIVISEDWVEGFSDVANAELYLMRILAWVMLSGIAMVTVYDQVGSLSLHTPELEKSIGKYLVKSGRKFQQVSVLVEANGADFYPKLISGAIEAPLNGMKTYARLEYMHRNTESYNEPGVVLVLDPKNKRELFSYNPWSIRLSEFTFLNEARPSKLTVQSALRKYAKIEKRFGKYNKKLFKHSCEYSKLCISLFMLLNNLF